MIGSIGAIRSPYSPPPSRPARAVEPGRAEPLDTVAPGPSPAVAERATGRSWRAIGAAVLLAAPLIAGGLSAAHADSFDYPVSTSQRCTLPQDDVSQIGRGPVSADRLQQMRQDPFNAPDPVDQARDHSDAFATMRSLLEKQGRFLERFAASGNGELHDGSCTVRVEREGDTTRVEMSDTDHGGILLLHGGERTVTIRQGDLEETLRDTPQAQEVTTGAVSRTLWRADVDGHRRGDFDVSVEGGAHLHVFGSTVLRTDAARR